MSSHAKPRIVELDFGMGNIRSLQKAFEHLGQPVEVLDHADGIESADALLLPGDGAFGRAMLEIKQRQLLEPILAFYKSGKPIFGICIGFQILFTASDEFGWHKGLNLLQGDIRRFTADNLDIPHMGWAKTQLCKTSELTKGIALNEFFYYVHSYRLSGRHSYAIGSCDYDGEFTSIIEKDNLFGTQFHPEKSQKAGLKIIENFISLVKKS